MPPLTLAPPPPVAQVALSAARFSPLPAIVFIPIFDNLCATRDRALPAEDGGRRSPDPQAPTEQTPEPMQMTPPQQQVQVMPAGLQQQLPNTEVEIVNPLPYSPGSSLDSPASPRTSLDVEMVDPLPETPRLAEDSTPVLFRGRGGGKEEERKLADEEQEQRWRSAQQRSAVEESKNEDPAPVHAPALG